MNKEGTTTVVKVYLLSERRKIFKKNWFGENGIRKISELDKIVCLSIVERVEVK